jgi:predicted component of type VI protein secretion system
MADLALKEKLCPALACHSGKDLRVCAANVVEACARSDYLSGAENHMKDHHHSPQTPQRPAATRNRPAHQ